MAIVTAVQGDFTLSLAEYKGIVPITYQTELHFRRFYYLKLCQPAKTKASETVMSSAVSELYLRSDKCILRQGIMNSSAIMYNNCTLASGPVPVYVPIIIMKL